MHDLTGITIAFDLDGTLVDTAPDLAGTLNAVLAEEGITGMNIDAARAFVGQGAAALLDLGFRHAGVMLDDANKARLVARFIEIYQAHMTDASVPYPGVTATLTTLKAHGATLTVCTNKLTHLSNQLLKGLDLDGFFTAVIGQDATPARKPDPRHVITAITAAGGTPARAVMIGDSDADLLAARAAHVPFALYTPGYGADHARTLTPDATFESYDALPVVIARLLA